MSPIIAAKYGGPCIKCGKKIKAGRFVNWERGRGISHLDETDNKKLSFSMLDPSHVEDGCHPKAGGLPPDAHHKEEKTMDSEEKIVGSNGNDDTINVSDLIKVLQGMKGDVAKPPVVRTKALTDKQISFCELMALGSDRADAYTSSYDISNPAFSSNAARKLLSQEKIRNKIAELRVELEDMPAPSHEGVETEMEDPNDVIRPWKGAGRGWTVRLTEKQERFCQARANGDTIMEAFKKSGYHAINWTERRVRKQGNRLMRLKKIKARIADLASGCAPDIKVVVAGEDSHEASRTGTGPTPTPFTADGTKVGTISMPDLAELNEFVDNFVELIKAHGRLFHHAVVTRGQKEVGIPGADVEGVEEAVGRSIETLRETLSEKLLIPSLRRLLP
jgi:hypothetical protein